MRPVLITWLATALVLSVAASHAGAEITAEIASSRVIRDQATRSVATDLVRFKDRWFLACPESNGDHADTDSLRVITSADGAKWESAALIKSPTPNRGLSDPKFTITPDGRLMLSAVGVVVPLDSTDPLPRFGGTVQSMAWNSADGQTWGTAEYIGVDHFPFSRVVWHKNTAYTYARGCICGSMQTVAIFAKKDGRWFQGLYRETFAEFFPDDGAVIFDGDVAHCLMSRVSATIGNARQTGLVGTARAPYTDWEWKELDTRISVPNLIRLPDQRVVGAVGLYDRKSRTSLCEFDLAAGKVKEILELPTGGTVVAVGLALHGGDLWVSYPAGHGQKRAIHLARVKLK